MRFNTCYVGYIDSYRINVQTEEQIEPQSKNKENEIFYYYYIHIHVMICTHIATYAYKHDPDKKQVIHIRWLPTHYMCANVYVNIRLSIWVCVCVYVISFSDQVLKYINYKEFLFIFFFLCNWHKEKFSILTSRKRKRNE